MRLSTSAEPLRSAIKFGKSVTMPIARVLTCASLIAPLKVARDTCHELLGTLCIQGLDFCQELEGHSTAQGRGEAAANEHHNYATLALVVSKTKVFGRRHIRRVRGRFEGSGALFMVRQGRENIIL
jgi:hypothetical protein